VTQRESLETRHLRMSGFSCAVGSAQSCADAEDRKWRCKGGSDYLAQRRKVAESHLKLRSRKSRSQELKTGIPDGEHPDRLLFANLCIFALSRPCKAASGSGLALNIAGCRGYSVRFILLLISRHPRCFPHFSLSVQLPSGLC